MYTARPSRRPGRRPWAGTVPGRRFRPPLPAAAVANDCCERLQYRWQHSACPLMSVFRSGSCIMTSMRLSARADYALRAAIELAAAHDGHVTAEQLAQAQNIPGKFLETILTHLRRSNIVRSQRGPDGGFWL